VFRQTDNSLRAVASGHDVGQNVIVDDATSFEFVEERHVDSEVVDDGDTDSTDNRSVIRLRSYRRSLIWRLWLAQRRDLNSCIAIIKRVIYLSRALDSVMPGLLPVIIDVTSRPILQKHKNSEEICTGRGTPYTR